MGLTGPRTLQNVVVATSSSSSFPFQLLKTLRNPRSWSGTCGSGKSGAGGEWIRRKKKFAAPRCNCGAYAILFHSSTSGNPNRLFFGCSNFKTSTLHCRYFAWLDEYVASFAVNEAASTGQVSEPMYPMMKLEEKLLALESLVAKMKIGNKGSATSNCLGVGFFLLGIALTIGFLALFRV
ncbi:hypothetical protein PIB30_015692 [Stylosanthes scabra]|uniref:GRF-type domain-containing protein n=1 Tax=Stylosanthes scabra TaxID=79078 RepID=A0ABU6VA97_9FABA|nr:hypothetical protein [Stylosanthes scabra]